MLTIRKARATTRASIPTAAKREEGGSGSTNTIAAICAAPGVLAHAGLLKGRTATSYPGFLRPDSAPGLQLSEAPVVIDGKVVTSRGPGTAIEFGLALIGLLEGSPAAQIVRDRLQLPA